MKRMISLLMIVLVLLAITACESNPDAGSSSTIEKSSTYIDAILEPKSSATEPVEEEVSSVASKTLIICFSHTGTTKQIAEYISTETDGDLFPILPKEEYPNDYNTLLELARQEKQDNTRPLIKSHIDNMDEYTTIFIGYPIWHGDMPMVIYSFLEEYDFAEKTVIPFCTSGSNGLSDTVEIVREQLADSSVLDGLSITSGEMSQAETIVTGWLNDLEINKISVDETLVSFTFDDKEMIVQLNDSIAAQSFASELPLELAFEDFRSMEKISYLSAELDITGSPDFYDPSVYDLCYYVPWGNICFFYEDLDNDPNLVHLGSILSGNEYLAEISDGSVVSVKKI